MRAELKKIHEKLQVTMIYVTHDQIEAMTMGDKICVMKDGVIQQVDTPLALYEKPKNKFVAGFIGSPPMNFVNVTVERDNGDIFLSEDTFKLKLPRNLSEKVKDYVGKTAILGIRPEDMYDKLFYSGPAQEGSTITLTVDLVEPMGSEVYLHLRSAKNNFVLRADPHNTAKPNQIIEVVVNMSRVHIFDFDTEQAIV